MTSPTLERIYLDAANGAPLSSGVRKAMETALTLQGNPASLHAHGAAAALAIEKGRRQTAALIHAQPSEIVFTSSGTEANALALKGLACAAVQGQSPSGTVPVPHLVISAIEHLSILHLARKMERQGFQVTVIPVDWFGRVDLEELEKALTPETALVSIQWASGEVGTLQGMAQLVRRVQARQNEGGQERGILFHTDAVSAVGQVPIDVRQIPVDALSMAAGPFGGPSGTGALYLRKGVRLQPILVGGGQEEGRRSGTENLLGIVGMGEAAAEAQARLETAEPQRLISLRDRLIHGILKWIPDAVLHGDSANRLPGHASIGFPGVDAESLILALDGEGISAGLGSACTHLTLKASHVLRAMGVKESVARSTITLTLGPDASDHEIDRSLEILPRVVRRLRRLSGEPAVHPSTSSG